MADKIKPEDVDKRLKQGDQVPIIDVREIGEVREGKIPGAIHIPLGQLAIRKNELNKDTTYVVVCQSGNRSKAACGMLNAFGIKTEDMLGGMNSWTAELEK